MGGLLLQRGARHEPKVVVWLRALYRPLLLRVVSRYQLALAGVLVLVTLGALVGATRGVEFVPRLEEGDVAIQVTRPPSVSLAEATRGTTAVERALKAFPEVVRVVSRTGSPDVATDVMGPESVRPVLVTALVAARLSADGSGNRDGR
jgi:cobalt-zinc-cadmium resistance protein CzcA